MGKVWPMEDAIPSSHTSGSKQEMTTLKVSKVTREAVTTGARASWPRGWTSGGPTHEHMAGTPHRSRRRAAPCRELTLGRCAQVAHDLASLVQ